MDIKECHYPGLSNQNFRGSDISYLSPFHDFSVGTHKVLAGKC